MENKDNKNYGIIHEIGDYGAFQKLNEEDNEKYKVQLEQERRDKEKNNNR